MRKKELQKEFYFSDRLRKELDKISSYPVTVVSAPSGFGKTTAIREYLKESLPGDAKGFWYTCFGESTIAAWAGICELFSNVDVKLYNDLRNLNVPTIDTLFYMITYLREAPCQQETYLVVDNYQMMKSGVQQELLSAFSMHGHHNLHIIFITHPLVPENLSLIHNDNIHSIPAPTFFFNQQDTAKLFRMAGIRLAEKDLKMLYEITEGWVAAIQLQIINYKQTGLFDGGNDIGALVEKTIWENLNDEEKELLLAVAVLDSFTIRQAANIVGKEALPRNLENLLTSNVFIRYLPDKHSYSMHGILQGCLRNRFHHYLPEKQQQRIYQRAGQTMALSKQYYQAIRFFYTIKDYERILSMPFDQEYTDIIKENHETDFIDSLVSECPEEILCKYPSALLRLAYQALAFEKEAVYKKLCQLLYQTIQAGEAGTKDEMRENHGEYMLLTGIAAFNDFQQMKALQQKAWELLKRPSIIFNLEIPWIFGTISALDVFWSKPGELENALCCMDEMMQVYLGLTQFNGAGADALFRAEALLMQGEDAAAEVLCYKALYKAKNYKQTSICICTEMLLARIAILRGDFEGYQKACDNIQNYGKENSRLYILRMVEQGMSAISLILDLKDNVIPWLHDLESIKRAVYSPVVPQAQVLYLKLLLIEERYTEFYAALQYILESDNCAGVKPQYLMPKVYSLIFLSMAEFNKGNQFKAQEYLMQSLMLALPDKVYLPFAQAYGKLRPVFELAMLSCPDKEGVRAVIALGKRQEKGVKAIRKSILSCKSPLTPREREVALLIKSRLTAKEIADKLYISDATVRTILRNVYSKLDIHSKTELISKDF